MGYQKVIIQGNLTKDNELKYLPSGTAICNNSIAVTEKFKKQDGSTGESTMFIDFTVFGKRAETLNQYTHRGSKILIDGKLDFQQWKAQDGSGRSKHIIKVENFTFLDSKDSQPQQGQYNQNGSQNQNYNTQQQGGSHQNRTVAQSGNGGQHTDNMNQQGVYDQNIPTIDIDLDPDEIPHSRQ